MKPGDFELHNGRGYAYLRRGQHLKAIDDHSEAIRLRPHLPIPFHNRGFSYAELGEYQKAIVDYDEAIRLYDTLSSADAEVYMERAEAHDALGMSEAAAEDRARADEIIRLEELEELEEEL